MNKIILSIAFLAATCVAASAADFGAKILDFSGDPVADTFATGDPAKPCDQPGAKKCLTVRGAIMNALLWPSGQPPYQDDRPTPDEKMHRGFLALKLSDDKGDLVFGIDDSAMIKRLVSMLYGPLVLVRVIGAISPADLK